MLDKKTRRYNYLMDLQKLGAIRNLKQDVEVDILPTFHLNNKMHKSVKYTIDFTYCNSDNKLVAETTHKFKTDYEKLVQKLFAFINGYEITEI